MINKQNMWFITLFSLILVLSIYYITISDDKLAKIANQNSKNVAQEVKSTESDILVALRVNSDEAVLAEMEKLQTILLDETATVEEKNDAYNSLQIINSNKGKESQIEKLIKTEFNLKSFVKIKNDQINITIDSREHNSKIANNIMQKIQNLYQNKMYITIKFQGK